MVAYFTPEMGEAIISGKPRIPLIQVDHPSGIFRAWGGVGPLDYNGVTWIGAGNLVSVATVKATTDLQIQELAFTLSGVSVDMLNLLDENVRNRIGNLWLACLNDQGQIIRDPWPMTEAELDYQTFDADDDGTCKVTVIGREGFYTLDRPLDEVWSPENHKLTYPDDTGLDGLPLLQNKQTPWTRI